MHPNVWNLVESANNKRAYVLMRHMSGESVCTFGSLGHSVKIRGILLANAKNAGLEIPVQKHAF